MRISEGSCAIVHDYLNQRGGAERVVLELARMWPQAPIYTSLYRPRSTFAEFADHDVRTTALDAVPLDAGFRALAPLYPLAFRSLGVLPHDLVISSSSGWSHGVQTSARSVHVVYCHNPPRWLHRPEEHLGSLPGGRLLAPLIPLLRRWDRRAARRADLYVANCENVKARIEQVYGRDAEIVYPPVDVGRFRPAPRGERLLVVSRLLPYKRVDLIIRAANRRHLGLDVIGVGPALPALRELAGATVAFHGSVSDETVVKFMQRCSALCLAGTEDFGITPIEALAAGKPVVAYAAGGVLETIEDGATGALFDELRPEAVLEAIDRAATLGDSPEALAAHASRFSVEAFRARFSAVLTRALGAGERG